MRGDMFNIYKHTSILHAYLLSDCVVGLFRKRYEASMHDARVVAHVTVVADEEVEWCICKTRCSTSFRGMARQSNLSPLPSHPPTFCEGISEDELEARMHTVL